jgi:glycosyltransferase involved in cell wall biosynthesis
MPKILHLTQWFSPGGAGRALLGVAKYSSSLGDYQHSIASLLPADSAAVKIAAETGIFQVYSEDREAIKAAVDSHDIVHIHWWNSPQMNEFLHSDLPQCRILAWFHVGGHIKPQVITPQLVDFVDYALACSPYTYECKAIQSLSPDVKAAKTGMAYGAADFERLKDVKPKAHDGFNIGYIGSVDFIKMHRDFVPISIAADIPDVRFLVCGGGESLEEIRRQIAHFEVEDRFALLGYIDDIPSVLSQLDLYGYPLCEDTYAASEINLQEVMFAGIVPVVFPYGGIKRLITHNETGYVVSTTGEYSEALEYLYHHPEERSRLGQNAKKYAAEVFPAEKAAEIIHNVYQDLLKSPKRKHVWAEVTYDLRRENNREIPDGAKALIESLGNQAEEFVASVYSGSAEEVFAAEEKIADCTDLMRMGGIVAYQKYYPEDPLLSFWAGLAYYGSGQMEKAVVEFTQVLSKGFTEWRVLWYIALAAVKLNNFELAGNALSEILKVLPNFKEAHDLLRQLDNQKPVLRGNDLFPVDCIQEFRCPAFTRSGIKRLANVMYLLDICTYWDRFDYMWRKADRNFKVQRHPYGWLGSWFSGLELDSEVSFRDPVGFSFGHILTSDIFQRKFIRLVRDGRDTVHSHYKRYAATLGPQEVHTVQDGLDTPLLFGQGAMFDLGPIEEWILQEKLIEELIPTERVFYIYFEQLKANDVDAVQNLLGFMGIFRTSEEIQRALESSQREKFADNLIDTQGQTGKWKDGGIPEIQERFCSLASSLAIKHPYEIAPAEQPPAISAAWKVAANLWIKWALARVVEKLGEPPVDLLPFAGTLEKFCRHVENLPLLQVIFCSHLLANKLEQEQN